MISSYNLIIAWIIYPALLVLLFAVVICSGYYLILGIKLAFDKLLSLLRHRWPPHHGGGTTPAQPFSPVSHASTNYNVYANNVKEKVKVMEKIPPPEKYKRPRNRSIATCAICLEDLVDGDLCQSLPECQHTFHSPCIKPWLIQMQNCPICRQSFSVV